MNHKIKQLQDKIIDLYRGKSVYHIEEMVIYCICKLRETQISRHEIKSIKVVSQNSKCYITIVLSLEKILIDGYYISKNTFEEELEKRYLYYKIPVYKNDHVIQYNFKKDFFKYAWQLFNLYKNQTYCITIEQSDLGEQTCLL